MGIFDNLIPKSDPNNNGAFSSEAAAIQAIIMSGADNGEEIGDLEIEYLSKVCSIKPLLKSVSAAETIKEYYSIKMRYSQSKVIDLAAPMLSDESKKAVFVICFDMLFSDLTVDEREKSFIDTLASKLNLDTSFIDNVTEIMRLKYM